MENLLNIHYKNMKQKLKIMDADIHYKNDLCNMLCQIVRIDDFEEKCNGIDYDIFQSVKLLEGVVGLGMKRKKLYCIFNINEVGLPNNTMHWNHVIGSYYDEKNEIHVEEFTVGKDIVLWYNNPFSICENDIYKYADMLSEIDASIMIDVLKTRYTDVIEVESEQEKQQYQQAIRETKNGEPVVYVHKKKDSLLDTDRTKDTLNDVRNTDKIQYLTHLYDSILTRFCNRNGISVNMGSGKQAQQSVNEVSKVDAYSWLNPVSMLYQCQLFCMKVKELFDIDLDCHFGIVHEINFEKYVNECTANDSDNNVQTESEDNLGADIEELTDDNSDQDKEDKTNNENQND